MVSALGAKAGVNIWQGKTLVSGIRSHVYAAIFYQIIP